MWNVSGMSQVHFRLHMAWTLWISGVVKVPVFHGLAEVFPAFLLKLRPEVREPIDFWKLRYISGALS